MRLSKSFHAGYWIFFSLLLTFQSSFSQSDILSNKRFKIDGDTTVPFLVNKVQTYSLVLKRAHNHIHRAVEINDIANDLPAIEKRLNGLKTRLEKKDRPMNLRSLNSAMILLDENIAKLQAYQANIGQYRDKEKHSNKEVNRIINDPDLQTSIGDTLLVSQLNDIKKSAVNLDSLQKETLKRLNLMYNQVSVYFLLSKDLYSEMQYKVSMLKTAMWGKEESPLLEAKSTDYPDAFASLVGLAIQRGGKVISIFLTDEWHIFSMALLIFIIITAWLLSNKRLFNKIANAKEASAPLLFFNHTLLISSVFAFFVYGLLFFVNSPMAFLHAGELLRLLTLSVLIFPFLNRPFRIVYVLLCLLWIYYALDDLLLESAFGERWALFGAGILYTILLLIILRERSELFTVIPESPVTKLLVIFCLGEVILSLFFNLTGRVSLAKIVGISSIQALFWGLSLKVFSEIVLEAIYLQAEVLQDSRLANYLDFNQLQTKYRRALWIFCTVVWIVFLFRNWALYDWLAFRTMHFLDEKRVIGSVEFSVGSVVIFILIIWLSSVISNFINFFFGNEANNGKRTRMGSMMLLIRLAVWAIGVLLAFAAAGIPFDKVSIIVGALSVGIGFGLQNIVNNLVSGIIIAFERPIQIGDQVEIGSKTGVIKEIGVRASKLDAGDGADVIIPNGDLLSQHLVNWTLQNRNKRMSFAIELPYMSDIRPIFSSMQEVLQQNKQIMQNPAPSVSLDSFGESEMKFVVKFWVIDLSQGNSIKNNLMIEMYDALTKAGIKVAG